MFYGEPIRSPILCGWRFEPSRGLNWNVHLWLTRRIDPKIFDPSNNGCARDSRKQSIQPTFESQWEHLLRYRALSAGTDKFVQYRECVLTRSKWASRDLWQYPFNRKFPIFCVTDAFMEWEHERQAYVATVQQTLNPLLSRVQKAGVIPLNPHGHTDLSAYMIYTPFRYRS